MQKNSAAEQTCADPSRDEPPLPKPNKKARALHAEIVAELQGMLAANAASPLDQAFAFSYRRVLDLFGAYQQEIISRSAYSVTCGKHCNLCCYHWAADVYSFEAAIIAEHIKQHVPYKIPTMCATLRDDAGLLQTLDDLLDERVLKDVSPDDLQMLNRDELLLEGFYQLRRACPLLDAQGACSLYLLRPMSCRAYLSFSNPLLCDPDTINAPETRTFLCTLEQEADELLEKLHLRYDHCDGDTSLRTLLPYYLDGFRDCIFKRVI